MSDQYEIQLVVFNKYHEFIKHERMVIDIEKRLTNGTRHWVVANNDYHRPENTNGNVWFTHQSRKIITGLIQKWFQPASTAESLTIVVLATNGQLIEPKSRTAIDDQIYQDLIGWPFMVTSSHK